jgi:uncharacterized DUF497 family protein
LRRAFESACLLIAISTAGFITAFASLIFEGPVLMLEDKRRDYGERRFVAIGLADQIHITLVFTDRAGLKNDIIRRIISARRSSRKERKLYDQSCKKSQ